MIGLSIIKRYFPTQWRSFVDRIIENEEETWFRHHEVVAETHKRRDKAV
jgi:hypothetical protein